MDITTLPSRTLPWSVVEAAQAGDPAAFDLIYRTYHPMVVSFVRYLGSQPADAQDVASEVFTRLYVHIGTLTDRGRDIGAWCRRVARNIVADSWRRSEFRRTVPVAEVPDRCASDDVAATVVAELDGVQVWGCVDRLGAARDAECVRLRFGAGLSVRETAAVMGLVEGSVRAATWRAVSKLRVMRELTDLVSGDCS